MKWGVWEREDVVIVAPCDDEGYPLFPLEDEEDEYT